MSVQYMNDAPGVEIIKIEDSPSPGVSIVDAPPMMNAIENEDWTSRTPTSSAVVNDPKDPEGFLRRCSGHNKKTKARCSATIGRNAQHTHPTFLPTCYAHRDQQTYAGWCQLIQPGGERCGRLFRWTPPYFELCTEHQGHPDTPCYFMKLPLELRLEVFRYLLPTSPIDSCISPLHHDPKVPLIQRMPPPPVSHSSFISVNPSIPPSALGNPLPLPPAPRPLPPPRVRRYGRPMQPPPLRPKLFPSPLLDLLLISREIYAEAKDLLHSTIPFTIDIRKDGTFMCGRRLLEPRRADGSSHFTVDDAEKAAKRFINSFDWTAVKNYNVDILVENWNNGPNMNGSISADTWDEEVEIFDIRDYVRVAVNGILAKSRNLCRLNVRVGFSKFDWSAEKLLDNAKLLVGPFERLRNVRQPRLLGVFDGAVRSSFMIHIPHTLNQDMLSGRTTPLCSIPTLPAQVMLIGPRSTAFDSYRKKWEKWISHEAAGLPKKPPIEAMFTEFKDFYSRLSYIVPDIMQRHGRMAFLHRARVARENEDVESFRHLRNELIQYWNLYLDQEEQKKHEINARLSRMLDADVYPSHEIEESPRRRSMSSDDDCVILDPDKMTAQGIPMQVNQMTQTQRQRYHAMQLQQIRVQRRLFARHSRHVARGQAAGGPSVPSPPLPQLGTPSAIQDYSVALLQAENQGKAQTELQLDDQTAHCASETGTTIDLTRPELNVQSTQHNAWQTVTMSDSTMADASGDQEWRVDPSATSPSPPSSMQIFEPNGDPGIGSSATWSRQQEFGGIFSEHDTVDTALPANDVLPAEKHYSLSPFLLEGQDHVIDADDPWSLFSAKADGVTQCGFESDPLVGEGEQYVPVDGLPALNTDFRDNEMGDCYTAYPDSGFYSATPVDGPTWDGKGKGKARADVVYSE